MTAVAGKVVLVGDTHVGKTAIVNSCLGNSIDTAPTVGANSNPIVVNYEGKDVTLNVWDTAGQENYRCLVPYFARLAQVAIIVFALDMPETFESVEYYIHQMRDESNIPNLVLVGNKSDLPRVVPQDDIDKICSTHNIECIITSAFSGSGISDLFYLVAQISQSHPQPDVQVEINVGETVVDLENPSPPVQKKGSCC